jgi:hypothetical protein
MNACGKGRLKSGSGFAPLSLLLLAALVGGGYWLAIGAGVAKEHDPARDEPARLASPFILCESRGVSSASAPTKACKCNPCRCETCKCGSSQATPAQAGRCQCESGQFETCQCESGECAESALRPADVFSALFEGSADQSASPISALIDLPLGQDIVSPASGSAKPAWPAANDWTGP